MQPAEILAKASCGDRGDLAAPLAVTFQAPLPLEHIHRLGHNVVLSTCQDASFPRRILIDAVTDRVVARQLVSIALLAVSAATPGISW